MKFKLCLMLLILLYMHKWFLTSCRDKALALLAPLAMYKGGDMLGRANAGYNLLIGNPIYISYTCFL